MEINIFNQYGDIAFDYERITKDIANEFVGENSVGLILVNQEDIRNINFTYRHLDYVTDVISFEDKEDDYLGDIFICVDKVFEQAKNYLHSVEREFAFLLVHGLLHLNGYDHETKQDEEKMFAKQEEILSNTSYVRKKIVEEKNE